MDEAQNIIRCNVTGGDLLAVRREHDNIPPRMTLPRLMIAAIALLAAPPFLHAEEPAPATRQIEVRFAPPGDSGTISLGIYDSSGKLRRTLCDEWPLDRFQQGRDALGVVWDGLDDAGNPVPAGTYAARGYAVGRTEVGGEAFHFNDWIDTEDAPRIVTVRAQQLLPGGDILLAARLANGDGALVRYSPESDARWHTVTATPRPDPAKTAQLAVSDTLAFVLLDGDLTAVRLDDGALVPLPPDCKANVQAIAARGSRLAILREGAITFYTLPDFAVAGTDKQPPANISSLALLDGDAVVAATADGRAWVRRTNWAQLDIPDDVLVREVSGGRESTFWVRQETADGKLSVAQYSPEEGRLAEWKPGAEGGKLEVVAGATDGDSFAATLALPGAQRTAAIRRKKGTEGWEFVFDKKITESAGFGLANGVLAAAASELPDKLTVKLVENPLDPTAARSLTLQASVGRDGATLTADGGLSLLRVSDQTGFFRVMVMGGAAPNTARFFQGDGACVEEYIISGLDDIVAIDAGVIELTPSGEAPPPSN